MSTVSGLGDAPLKSSIVKVTGLYADIRYGDGVNDEVIDSAMIDFFFGSTTATALKRWNGSAWVTATLKRYNGATWVSAVLKRWNGASWVTV